MEGWAQRKELLENEEAMTALKLQYADQIENIVANKSIVQEILSTIRSNYKKTTKITKSVSDMLQLDKAQEMLSNYLDSDVASTNTITLEDNCKKILQHLDEELDHYRAARIDNLLEEAGVNSYDDYETALKSSDAGYSVINKRDIDETFVNNYNREMILAWDANLDIQPCCVVARRHSTVTVSALIKQPTHLQLRNLQHSHIIMLVSSSRVS